MQDHHAGRIEGYAIVSEDGTLATEAGIMPDSLKFDADARFFEAGLNGVDVVVLDGTLKSGNGIRPNAVG